MRLKLVLLTSLVAAILSAGAATLIVFAISGRQGLRPLNFGYRGYHVLSVVIYLPALICAIMAAIFVYRHTARRRKLQAALSGVLVLIFSVIAFGITMLFS